MRIRQRPGTIRILARHAVNPPNRPAFAHPGCPSAAGGMGQNRLMFVLGTHEKNTLAQLADVASRAERVALMADGHLGYICLLYTSDAADE